MKLILASSSKFKKEILDKVGIKHKQIENDYKENINNYENVYDYVKKLSYNKALHVKNRFDKGIILGLDTVAYCNEKILEKPNNLEEARDNIILCKNNITKVITGFTLINLYNNEVINDYVETEISLRDISNEDIDYYLDNEKDALYVSGFVIETIISNFVEKISGSYYNVLGIPIETIYKHINKWGYCLKDFE